MKDLARFFSTLCLITLLALIQGIRLLSLGGVNPNLILIFFSGLIMAPDLRQRIKPDFFIALLIFIFILEYFFSPFWLVPWLVLILMIVAAYLLRRFFTGRPFLDFLLILGFGTPIFYALLRFISGTVFRGGFVVWETAYNLILGIVFWFFLDLLKKYDWSRA